jgi:hypothetical protein
MVRFMVIVEQKYCSNLHAVTFGVSIFVWLLFPSHAFLMLNLSSELLLPSPHATTRRGETPSPSHVDGGKTGVATLPRLAVAANPLAAPNS